MIDGLIGLSKIFWYGTVEVARKNKYIKGFYIVIAVLVVITTLIGSSTTATRVAI